MIMHRKCVCCQATLARHWNFDKCGQCFKIASACTDDVYFDLMRGYSDWSRDERGKTFRTTNRSRNKDKDSSSKPEMFKPPVWY